MCGIAGELQFGHSFPEFSGLEQAVLRQESRGPDGEGLYFLNNIALGHRRLKIFDLTDRSAQPMLDHTLGLGIVFNGEIYNFRELRTELAVKGYRFVSDGDTEVILKAYHAWGKECLKRLHGMFAFAIWERDSGNLVLARDRMGIKPLYFADSAQGFRFASTLPALLAFEGIDNTVDPDALYYYLTFHEIPEPLTILRGIRKLAPGSVLTVSADGKKQLERYWSFHLSDASVNHHKSESQWLDTAKNTLLDATRRQLAADVPVGILLSGGLDSSLLVALAKSINNTEIQTFSIGFEGRHGMEGDEFRYSDAVAKHYATGHHKLFVSNRQLFNALPDCVKAMSEPMASHDNVAFYLLSKEVSQHVKVVLSGQGADEIFAGYHSFQKVGFCEVTPAEAPLLLSGIICDRSYDEYCHTVTPEYRVENFAAAFLDKTCSESGSKHLVNHLLTYESTYALANDPLARVDNMAMASGLEARVPFLDEKVVDLAITMPLQLKLLEGGKYILKVLARSLLPHEVINRPKGYFPVPMLKYLHGPALELVREVLNSRQAKERGLFNPLAVQSLLKHPDQLAPNGGSKLWQVGLLEYWLQLQGL